MVEIIVFEFVDIIGVVVMDSLKVCFVKVIEEVKVGVQVFGKEVQGCVGDYCEKVSVVCGEWFDEVKVYGNQVKEKVIEFVVEGKVCVSEVIFIFGKMVEENVEMIDVWFGVKYGDYVCKVSILIQDVVVWFDVKELGEIGEEVCVFVCKSFGFVIGFVVVVGYMFVCVFCGLSDGLSD